MDQNTKKEEAKWHTVGIFEELTHTLTSYIDDPEFKLEGDLTIDNLPNLESYSRVKLEPGTSYRVRICAINENGCGPWGECATYTTCDPGFPSAPSKVKISKSIDGVNLFWEPPPSTEDEILEYSVYLAVKSTSINNTTPPVKLEFVRVYCGPRLTCTVPTICLIDAHIDCSSSKPAIIFRITAKNKIGYGPATQVRWIQVDKSPDAADQAVATGDF